MNEVLYKNMENIDNSNILTKLGLKEREYFVVSAHRKENIDNDEKFKKLVESLNEVDEIYKEPIIFSTHPRTK